MKKYVALLLSMLLALGAATIACAEFDGVILPSPEEYLEGVPPCTGFNTQDNYYAYRYNHCGKEYDGDGNNAVWKKLEQYVQDVVSTGYFEVAYHEDDNSPMWCLVYTGPEEYLQETFSTKTTLPKDYAIEVSSLFGDASIYYSVDIQTTNLQETMERLGYAPPSGDGDCTICNGTGDCYKCGGSGYIYKTVLRNGKHETVHTRCDGALCSSGNCMACGGDGDI